MISSRAARLQAAIDKSCSRTDPHPAFRSRGQLECKGNAKALYERFGFEHEGLIRRASLIDGIYHDAHAMALLR
jgi:putative acetyltransferase